MLTWPLYGQICINVRLQSHFYGTHIIALRSHTNCIASRLKSRGALWGCFVEFQGNLRLQCFNFVAIFGIELRLSSTHPGTLQRVYCKSTLFQPSSHLLSQKLFFDSLQTVAASASNKTHHILFSKEGTRVSVEPFRTINVTVFLHRTWANMHNSKC